MATEITQDVLTIKVITRIKNLALFFVLLGLFSCDPARIYDEWRDIDKGSWSKDSSAVFKPIIDDSIQSVDIILGIRNTNDYSFSNLWCFVTMVSPDSVVTKDTVDLTLASPYGKWYGSGWGNLFTSLHYYKQNYRFKGSGEYTFYLQHGMRQEPLDGIQSVGLRLALPDK